MDRFIRRAAAVWAGLAVLLLAWSGLAYGVGAGERGRYHDQLRTYETREHFWNVVAGRDDARSGVLDKLAQDMHDLPIDRVYKFRGDSNRYGGIAEELGFDPFNGENCNECGPLKMSFADSVIDTKNGNVSSVIGQRPKEPGGVAGPSPYLWVVWLFSLPLAWVIHRRREEKRYASMPYEARLLRELNEAVKELPPGSPEWRELSQLRQRMQEAIDARIEYGEDEKSTLRIEELKKEAQDSLEAITEGNRALR